MGKAITIAVHLEDADMMHQAAQKGTGQPFGAERLGPLVSVVR